MIDTEIDKPQDYMLSDGRQIVPLEEDRDGDYKKEVWAGKIVEAVADSLC